jgi:hypothetical protein
MRGRPCLVVMGAIWLTAGCASMGMNSVQKLRQLSPGMSSDQVVEILGEPESAQMTEDKWILNYTLHENWKGFVPYLVVFDKDTRRLEAWFEDEEGYQRAQAQMGETFAPLLETGVQASGGAAPAGPNDPDLQRWITGNYYYFSSSQVVSASSERSFALCVAGRFRATAEFSASGSGGSGGATDWGSASQSGNAGRWTISGDRQSGTITLTYGNGSTRSLRYQVASQAEQTMYFDQMMFAYAGVANCG